MADTREIKDKYSRRDQFEDETELIDYLRVIWKWKWLIIAGTFLCTLVAGIYGLTRPAIYKASTIIEINPNVKLDPINKIKAMIEYGIFNKELVRLLELQGHLISNPLTFKADIPNHLNILHISYETQNPDSGKAFLDKLLELLEKNYQGKLENAKAEFDKEIRKKNESILDIQTDIQILKIDMENKIFPLKLEMKKIQANQTEKDLIGNIEKQIELIELKGKQSIISEEAKIDVLKSEVEKLKLSRDEMEGLIVRLPPTTSTLPNKGKQKSTTILSGVVGLIFFVFLAFSIEYIRNALKLNKMNYK